jgi:thioredoxin reductase (NADPH)
MQKRVFENPKITVHWNRAIVDVLGDTKVTGLRLQDTVTDVQEELAVSGVFLAIGHQPNSVIFNGMLDMDELGYLKVIPGSTATRVPGVFACGDVADKVYRQAVSAAGTGCMAAIDAERWLAEHT